MASVALAAHKLGYTTTKLTFIRSAFLHINRSTESTLDHFRFEQQSIHAWGYEKMQPTFREKKRKEIEADDTIFTLDMQAFSYQSGEPNDNPFNDHI